MTTPAEERYDLRPHVLLYLSGAPGTGKSTIMARLTEGCYRHVTENPLPHDRLYPADATTLDDPLAAEIGRRREAFAGTDALGMAINPVACQWIASRPYHLVLGEGDRLANKRFLTTADEAGFHVHLVHLTADRETLDVRCHTRGSKQSDSWRQGRATKAANLWTWAREEARLRGWTVSHHDTATRSIAEIIHDLAVTTPGLFRLPAAGSTVA